jgi:predicted PurR-regulated permease PerM
MPSLPEQLIAEADNASGTSTWLRRAMVLGITILVWVTLVGIFFWFLGVIAIPVLLLFLATILAYVLYPLVKLLHRFVPRALAILLAYVIVFVALSLVLFFVTIAAVQQLTSLSGILLAFQQDVQAGKYPELTSYLNSLGVTSAMIQLSDKALIAGLQRSVGQLLTLLSNAFVFFIYVIVITSVSVYLLIDGPRVIEWLKNRTPLNDRARIIYGLALVDRIAGGYLRGQILLATIMTALVTPVAYFLGVPYAILIGVIVFVTEFIPQIGAYISGAIGILFAATQGWETALIYGIYVSIVQGVIDGQILAPRILGKSVGIHPVISIFFLFVFGSIWGLWGAFLAAPIVGIVQVLIIASWQAWQQRNSGQFPELEEQKTLQGETGISAMESQSEVADGKA